MFAGAVGLTVHGMPQIGQLRKGLWVASGFGRQGLNTSAMAGQLVARSILWGDERWRLFSPFELVWAGGATGRVAGHLIGLWGRGSSRPLARWRYREACGQRIVSPGVAGARGRNQATTAARSALGASRARYAAASGTGGTQEGEAPIAASQESERIQDGSV